MHEGFPFANSSSPNDQDADVMHYPKPKVAAKRKEEEERYFVLTYDEVINQKQHQLNIKQEKENKKEQAKIQRQLKREAATAKKN